MITQPSEKSLRVCIDCSATYCINGDPSGYWICFAKKGVQVEGQCEFCKPTGKFSITKVTQ